MASLSFKQLFDRLQKSVDDSISKSSMDDIGKALVEIIRVRTRLGYGVGATGDQRQKLKPLSLLYREYRRKNRRLMSPQATVNRSNLTFTGQMLDSLDVVSSKKGALSIAPTGTRKGGLKNLTLARYVAEQGRPFMSLSNNELKQLSRIIDEGLNASLRRRLK
jgi:hypothetical protein